MTDKVKNQKSPTKPPSYFEAIFQLRECGDEVLKGLQNFVDTQRDPDMFIAKLQKVKTGIDVYLSSNQLGVKLASHLVKQFGGRVQTSSKLFSRSKQTSKNLMRLTVVYRGLDFEVGDCLALPVKRTVVRVRKLGQSVQCTDLREGKATGFFPNRTHYRKLEKIKTRISRVTPTIQVLHPETYQPVDVKNKLPVKIGREASVVYWNGWWIVKEL